jgi:hypothetical protein
MFGRHIRPTLAVVAAPTAIMWIAEVVIGAPVTNIARALAAWPLGATIGGALIAVTVRTVGANRVN